jgi:acetolactate synthase I/II/III large subunit
MMTENITAGGAIFARLKTLGVDYVFCNSGTDFPPIIEGLAEAAANDQDLPHAIVIPHEHLAMGMAHGYWQATGQTQAVMLHTNVGLANGSIGAINAAHDNVPVIMMSGRTPTTEKDHFGARTVPIGWGQEMRDQTALVREASKWDYELRVADQIIDLLDRASAIANSTPKGPVYLSLPREVLCEKIGAALLDQPPSMSPASTIAMPENIDQLADWIAEAKNPVIFSQRGTGTAEGFDALTALVDSWAIPVNSYWAQAAAIPTDHSMYIGVEPSPWVEEADLIILVDALAPWMPDVHKPNPNAKIVNIGPNPLFARTPVRNFRSHLSLAGETTSIIKQLAQRLAKKDAQKNPNVQQRREEVSARSEANRKDMENIALKAKGQIMTKAWVAKCLSDATEQIEESGRRTSVTSELGCPLAFMKIAHHNGYRQEPHSGGLGYSLPAAMGIQLAEPETLVFATMGDGSYIFANPTACHQVCEALQLPVITCVLNNEEWGAVRHSVTGLYPDGYAAKANEMPLTALRPTPAFTKTAEASRAYAERVEDGDELPGAIERAIKVATEERRQVLLDIKIS